MEGIHTLKDLVNPEDWLAKVDLKDAYFAIPIHQSHHQYLSFRFQGKCYQFKCLPFVPVISSLGYQDPEASTGSPSGDRGTTDSVHRRHPHSGGVQRVSEESCRGSSLPPAMPGFQNKSVLEPAQVMEFLGLTVDTVQMELRLPLEKIEDSCGVTGNDEGRACLRQRPSSSGGEDECNISGDSTSPTIFPPSTDGTVKYIKQPFPVLRGSGLPHPGMQGGIDVVGHPHDKLEWEVPPQEGSGHDNRLRCIPDRMGCNMSEPADRRSMVTDREQQAHKLPGAAGCDISSPDIPERQNQDVSTPPGGQHHSSGIHQQPGRNGLQGIGRPSKEPVDVVPRKEYPHHSPTPSRCSEYDSRCGVSGYDRSVRLATESSPVQQDCQPIWSHRSGHVCLTSDHSVPSLLQLAARSLCSGHRCLRTELVSD